jgi:hypothetical protein
MSERPGHVRASAHVLREGRTAQELEGEEGTGCFVGPF